MSFITVISGTLTIKQWKMFSTASDQIFTNLSSQKKLRLHQKFNESWCVTIQYQLSKDSRAGWKACRLLSAAGPTISFRYWGHKPSGLPTDQARKELMAWKTLISETLIHPSCGAGAGGIEGCGCCDGFFCWSAMKTSLLLSARLSSEQASLLELFNLSPLQLGSNSAGYRTSVGSDLQYTFRSGPWL